MPALVWAAKAGPSGGYLTQISALKLSQVFVEKCWLIKGDTPDILKQG